MALLKFSNPDAPLFSKAKNALVKVGEASTTKVGGFSSGLGQGLGIAVGLFAVGTLYSFIKTRKTP